MSSRLERDLDECLARIWQGEGIEACCRDFPDLQQDIGPFLTIALQFAHADAERAREEYRAASRTRAFAQFCHPSSDLSRQEQRKEWPSPGFGRLREWLSTHPLGPRKVLVPIGTLAAVAVLLPAPFQPWAGTDKPQDSCTVNSCSGSVDVVLAGQSDWTPAPVDTDLKPVERIQIGSSAEAFLTFFRSKHCAGPAGHGT